VWRSLDGSLWSALGTITRAATVGSVLEVPSASARPEHVEGGGSILVRLHSGALSGVADAAFYLGARVALVGAEVIAFRDVVQESATDWRVSYLARGCRGSEAAIASHAVGERFLLLEPSAWLRVEAPALGATAYFRGVTFGAVAAAADVIGASYAGRDRRPYAPAHLAAEELGGGAYRLTWQRRTRTGGAWRDRVDAELGEASERYRVRRFDGATLLEELETSTHEAELAGAAGGQRVEVAQLSAAIGAGDVSEVVL
jgi:hypothetical protein